MFFGKKELKTKKNYNVAHRVGIEEAQLKHSKEKLHKNVWCTRTKKEEIAEEAFIVRDLHDEIDLCWMYGEAGREWKEDDGTRKIIKLCIRMRYRTANEVK